MVLATLRLFVVALLVLGTVITLSGCGGGGVTVAPPGQFIKLENGRVVVEEGEGVLIIKAGQSQLPAVGFQQDGVTVELYEGDGFADPQTDLPSRDNLLLTFRVSREGTLQEDLRLPVGIYTALARDIHVVQDGKEFRSALTALVFEVYEAGGRLRTTLPVAFKAEFPALGSVIENSYVQYRTDLTATGGKSLLFMQHANGTVNMLRKLEAWPPEQSTPTHANVSFEALPGGPRLGNVQRLILKVFKP